MDEIMNKRDSIETFVKKKKMDIGFLLAGILIGIFFNWNIVEIVIFLVFIWSIVGPIASRYLVWLAFFFLSFTPVLLILGRKEQAEEYAIYAYYFLVMTVIRGIIEIYASDKEGDNLKSD